MTIDHKNNNLIIKLIQQKISIQDYISALFDQLKEEKYNASNN